MKTVAIKKMVRMNQAIQFDTHKFIKHLTENGFTERQAEVLAEEQVNLLNSNLATKADIESLRLATKTDIEKLRQKIKTDMANLRAKLVKWVYGAMIAQVILIVALLSCCRRFDWRFLMNEGCWVGGIFFSCFLTRSAAFC